MSTDTIAGKIKEVGGEARKNLGKLTSDKEAQIRGSMDEATGNMQKNYGKIKDAIKDAV